MRFKRNPDPLQRLVLELRSVSYHLNSRTRREIAAREADRIPLSKTERAGGGKAKVAALARLLLRGLPDLCPADAEIRRGELRACADALDSRFEVTSETFLGQRQRRRSAA